jgi:amino-acid N-acetyltransferase
MMDDMRIELRPARAGDFAAVVALLQQAGLPTGDLTAASIDHFLVANDSTADRAATVGAVALERYGDAGLLRSLVVAPDWRGRGVGEALVASIEHRARDAGLQRIALLTETAVEFFRRLGYRPTERSVAPASLRASSQFASLCPASATYMEKQVDEATAAAPTLPRAGQSA